MTAERWQQIKLILNRALELESSEREQYLTETCGKDTPLRAEVDSLIKSYESSSNILESPILPAVPEVDEGTIGSRLGAYQIVEEIGRGGMGTVFRAVRADNQFARQVAIKIVRRSLAEESIVRRFRHEREILATLDHPNIARIIDGGTTHDGLPYLVMEYINGVPIDRYCDRDLLSADQRLRLFRTVCSAVQCAHEQRIIHRDIKPSNILVTQDGVPKLLDFGIAKILTPDVSTQTITVTATVHRMMTPEYASPEQVKGEPVTEASDVYSLGVLLYELLTGHRPYHLKTHAPYELAHAICDAEPEAPSTAIKRLETVTRSSGEHRTPITPESVSKQRSSDPESLRRCLKGDLDNIILMALRKDPQRRYSSVAKFSEDIRRHLEGLPVVARRDTVSYRAGKFFSRHKAATISVATPILVLLTIGAVYFFSRHTTLEGTRDPIPFTTFVGNERQPAFSPDGTKVAFVWTGENNENSDIYIKPLDGGNVLRLTTDPAEDISPVWSPDGKRIAFLRSSKRETAIFVAQADGTGIHGKITELYPNRVEMIGRQLSWSSDGKYLAVGDKVVAEESFAIYLVDVATGTKHKVTAAPQMSIGDSTPAFSPDGKTLAFLRAFSSGVTDVYIQPLGGSDAKRITMDNRGALGLTWTSDGQGIVYSSNRTGTYNLWTVSASGGKPVRVSGVGDRVSDPSFARAGTYLAYSQFTEDTNIWRLELAPGTTRPVGPARRIIYSTQYDGGPGYSPDGKRIVFRSGRSGSNEIWICDDQGRNPIQLTHFGGPLTGTPRWVADGSHITFDSRPDGQAHIYTVDVNGGKPVRITEDPAEHVVASSSSDGKWIYFASNRSGSWQVWKIRFDRSETVQVTEKGGFAALESPDGQYVYYAKGRGLAGLWRVPVAGGEEEPVLEALKPGFWGYWAITRDGIYYVDKDPRDFKASINVYSLTTKQSTKIVDIENPPMIGSSAFAVSPNRRFIAYGQVDQSGSDIMLIDSAHSALR